MVSRKPLGSHLVIGIDATNLRQGGGVTYLAEMLRAAVPKDYGIARVVVWSNCHTLSAIEDRPWLVKLNPPELNRGLIWRTLWQDCSLSKAAREAGCDLLFVPGGSYLARFRPIVAMSQNMLPFENRELSRYGLSLKALRLIILRYSQTRSFRRADGVIFLTEYAKHGILSIIRAVRGQTRIVPHGLNARFRSKPRIQRSIAQYDYANPYRVLYVSIVDHYKHQWHVVEAVATLRLEGLPVALDLIGPAYPPALARLTKCLNKVDKERGWVKYHGPIPYEDLHLKYAQADLGIFASSCENMPIILLETMASGLPLACSNRGPMQDVLGDAGVYFDPERPPEIARALRALIDSPQLRAEKAKESYERSLQFTWTRCAYDTLAFLSEIARHAKRAAEAA